MRNSKLKEIAMTVTTPPGGAPPDPKPKGNDPFSAPKAGDDIIKRKERDRKMMEEMGK